MITDRYAHILAAEESKDGKSRFVVYVPDSGTEVYTFEQANKWNNFVFIEAVYLDGKRVAQSATQPA